MSSEARFALLPLEQLVPNDYNARRFEENMTPQRKARFEELVVSVKDKGVLEPLLVRPQVGDLYEVIAGERRFRAAREAADRFGESTGYVVPCMVRDVNDDEAFDLMVIENLQREDLTPLETARAFQEYLKRHGNTADAVAEISARTGVPPHAIRRQVRLLDLPVEVLKAWRAGELTQSHLELLTRVGDREQIMELYSACIRSKLTVRELSERIGAACPDLDRGFFDKSDCQVCPYNTAVQSGLFADASETSKCGNSKCFEAKQSEFLTANWEKSKAAEKFCTRGFRFSHRLQEAVEMIPWQQTAPRCLDCDCFVSILRLTGAVVGGYDRSCIGPRKCFEELYIVTPEKSSTAEVHEPEGIQEITQVVDEPAAPAGKTSPVETEPAKPETKPAAAESKAVKVETAVPVKTAATPTEKSGPVFNAARGEKCREEFFKAHLPQRINEQDPGAAGKMCLALLALVLASGAAKAAFLEHIGRDTPATPVEIARTIFNDMLSEELLAALQVASVAHIMEPSVREPVRRVVAESFGLHVNTEWVMTKAYLESLTKNELIRICEEPGVNLWQDEKVKAAREKRFKGRALVVLTNEKLISLILTSGANLKGRVPAEVLGKR